MADQSNITTAALIVAAGRGTRAGSGEIPKQYQLIGGRPMLAHSVDAFVDHPSVDAVQIVIGSEDEALYRSIAPQSKRILPPITGADTRQGSVLAGLAALAAARQPDRILIHDAARPFVSTDLIRRVADALERADAAIPTLPITSTLKSQDSDDNVTATIPRDGLHAAETPQGFRFSMILAAHQQAMAKGLEFTDDAAIAEWAGIPVIAVPGEPANIKVTTPSDLVAAESRMTANALLATGDVRVGCGYDVHALVPGKEIVLGGVAIPHTHALSGHSDADAGLHALTDAVLGALADGDIGVHFPPSDPRWKGVSSDRFLADAASRVTARGGIISHLDLTLIAEVPKIGPHRDAMRKCIAEICGIGIERVGVQATTNEGLGYIGRGEGIAAHATATIRLPFRSLP